MKKRLYIVVFLVAVIVISAGCSKTNNSSMQKSPLPDQTATNTQVSNTDANGNSKGNGSTLHTLQPNAAKQEVIPVTTKLSFDPKKISTDLVSANSKFAFSLFQNLNQEDKDQNIFISPFSISTALSMVYQGAGSTTKDAMAKTPGYSSIDIKKLNESYQNLTRYITQADDKVKININNSIWMREGQMIKPTFLSTNKDIFNARISVLDFSRNESVDTINKWIKDATEGKIAKMLDAPIPQEVFMYLINAIYFKGTWSEQFDPKKTQNDVFKTESGQTQDTMMMSRTGEIEYSNINGTRAIRLPYGKGKTAMYCVLPKEGESINSLIGSLDTTMWTNIKKSLVKQKDVLVKIPKFKMEYGVKNLNSSLIKMGMEPAFNEKADFTGICDNAAISRVIHKAVVDVNEEGSEAAAVTVTIVEMKTTGFLADPPAFIADRPMLFFINDDTTGSILFMGKLTSVK